LRPYRIATQSQAEVERQESGSRPVIGHEGVISRLAVYCVEKVAFLDFRQISGVPFALPGQRSSIVERSEWSQYAYDIAQILEATFSTQ
jgi:hypothetical protein